MADRWRGAGGGVHATEAGSVAGADEGRAQGLGGGDEISESWRAGSDEGMGCERVRKMEERKPKDQRFKASDNKPVMNE
ncbi:hypothetical protein ZWY2020_024124 [Hordeum vulgare]|nr:hypothetical protein ZWY2020_024124 [Hordeum vulgare]